MCVPGGLPDRRSPCLKESIGPAAPRSLRGAFLSSSISQAAKPIGLPARAPLRPAMRHPRFPAILPLLLPMPVPAAIPASGFGLLSGAGVSSASVPASIVSLPRSASALPGRGRPAHPAPRCIALHRPWPTPAAASAPRTLMLAPISKASEPSGLAAFAATMGGPAQPRRPRVGSRRDEPVTATVLRLTKRSHHVFPKPL